MKKSAISIYFILLALVAQLLAACDGSNKSDMNFAGETKIEAITVSGNSGDIDHIARKIVVNVPTTTDLTNLAVEAIKLSDGAVCNYPVGTKFDGTVPRAIHVTNGDVYTDYTLYVKFDNVEFFNFTINGKYSGSIDNAAREITVFVPMTENLAEMQVTFTATEGAVVTPASGSVVDFTNPVVFNAKLRSADVNYTVKVVKDDMSQEPKAFVGNAASIDKLGDEAKAACKWMMENVPNSSYVAIQDVIDGNVKLDDYKMIWCHFDWTDWPGQLWDSRDLFNSYWLRGGCILATRDGARYINDVWRIARDQQSPNNMFGGDSYETLTAPLGFTVTGHESHPLYDGLSVEADGRILLLDKGCSNSGRTLQWFVDWDAYGSMSAWEDKTGATALASSDAYDPNCVTIAEFAPYEALKGFTSGRVITIGTPAYEWFDKNNTDNQYRGNMILLTKNAINYLCQ